MAEAVNETSAIQAVGALLQEAGYRAQPDLDNNLIRTAAGGLIIVVYVKDDNLQFRCALEKSSAEIDLNHVNKFNSAYRFAKMYLDADGDIMVECDFLFRPETEEASSVFENMMLIVETSVSSMKEALRSTLPET